MCINKAQGGAVLLVELVLFIIIIGSALAGIVLVMSITTKGSANALSDKQTLTIAESLLEEIEARDFTNPTGGFAGMAIQANRASFDDVFDYNGFATTGIYPADGSATAIAELAGYNVSVTVVNPAAAWGSVTATNVAQITVTVTDASGQAVQALGYRVNY